MKENTFNPNKEPSPLNYSPYSENIDLIKTDKIINGYPIYKDNSSGDLYIKKHSNENLDNAKTPELVSIVNRYHDFFMAQEHLIALLTKGILQTSDVIEKDGKILSKVIDLNKIESSEENDLQAELYILGRVFSDYVHRIIDKDTAKEYAKSADIYNENAELHHNIAIQGDKFVHFDYGETLLKLLEVGEEDQFINHISSDARILDDKIRGCIEKKLKLVVDELLDEKFFNSAVTRSKIYQINNIMLGRFSSPEVLRLDLLKKAEIIMKIIEDLDKKVG